MSVSFATSSPERANRSRGLLVDTQRIAYWSAMAGFAFAIFSRFFVVTLGLPSLLNFIHFPLVFGAFFLTRHPSVVGLRRMLAAIAGFLGLVLFSGLVNGVEVARIVFAFVIWVEPVLFVYVVWATLADERHHAEASVWGRRFLAVAIGAQFVVMTWQLPSGRLVGSAAPGTADAMQGTFLGSGTGAHAAPAVVILGAMIAVDRALRGRKRVVNLLVAACAFILGLLGYAIAVTAFGLASLAIAVLIAGLSLKRRPRLAGLGLLVLVLVAAIALFAFPTIGRLPGEGDLDAGLSAKTQGPERVLAIMLRDPAGLVVGQGPGTTVSRAALETSGGVINESSPHALLGLETTEFTRDIMEILQENPVAVSSAYHPWSSFLGLLGDLGVVGLFLYILLWSPVVSVALRVPTGPRTAVIGTLVLAVCLGAFEIWLEDPGFILPVALLLTLAANRALYRSSVANPLEQSKA